MGELERLVERMQAGETGREIDALVLLALKLGVPRVADYRTILEVVQRHPSDVPRTAKAFDIPRYTTSVDAAMELAESLFPDDRWRIERVSPRIRVPKYEKAYIGSVGGLRSESDGKAAALVLAILRAKLAERVDPAS